MQVRELRKDRSLRTDQYRTFREIRKRVFSGCWRIDCSPDLKHFHSLQIQKSASVIEHPNLELVDIRHLKNKIEIETWSHRRKFHDAVSPDFNSCKLFGEVICNHVITTTTRFVLSEDCSCIITVIKFGTNFGEWRKLDDAARKRNELMKHKLGKC